VVISGWLGGSLIFKGISVSGQNSLTRLQNCKRRTTSWKFSVLSFVDSNLAPIDDYQPSRILYASYSLSQTTNKISQNFLIFKNRPVILNEKIWETLTGSYISLILFNRKKCELIFSYVKWWPYTYSTSMDWSTVCIRILAMICFYCSYHSTINLFIISVTKS